MEDGRDGDEANAEGGAGDLAKPGEADAVLEGGGPNGSRNGDEGSRLAGGDWIEVDKADRMGTGLACSAALMGFELKPAADLMGDRISFRGLSLPSRSPRFELRYLLVLAVH